MCGILAVIGKADRDLVQQLSKRQKHRGPDEWGMYETPDGSILSHEIWTGLFSSLMTFIDHIM